MINLDEPIVAQIIKSDLEIQNLINKRLKEKLAQAKAIVSKLESIQDPIQNSIQENPDPKPKSKPKPKPKHAKKNVKSHKDAILEVLRGNPGISTGELKKALESQQHDITAGTLNTTMSNIRKSNIIRVEGERPSARYFINETF
jgi:hypothetical protein